MITFNPSSGRWLAAAALALLLTSQSANATFGGDDGGAAYSYFDSAALAAGSAQEAIFTIDGRQLTTPTPGSGERDLNPVYSPDGKQIAFIVKRNSMHDSVDIMLADGTQRHTIFTADTIAPTAALYSLTWLGNGHRLALSVVNVVGGSYATGGLWLVESDGSAPYQIVTNGDSSEQTILEVDGSPTDDTILYRCRYRTFSFRLRDDFCIADTSGGVQRLPVDVPGVTIPASLGPPHFAPDGQSLIFNALYNSLEQVDYAFPLPWDPSQPLCSGSVSYQRDEIFRINRDGSALRQITNAIPVKYFAYSDATGATCGVGASQTFTGAALAPRGDEILAFGMQQYANASTVFGLFQIESGFATMLRPMDAGALLGQAYANWRPRPQALGVSIVDGHGNLLDGLKVELRRGSDGVLIDNRATNSSNGHYVFENPVPPGAYNIRATLIDNCGADPCTPIFDIRYSPEPADPVRIDWRVTVTADAQNILLDFDSADSTVFDSNISKPAWNRLDDMADIYYQLHRYAYWAKGTLNLGTIPTVHLYAFAVLDPIDTSDTVASLGDVYYRPGDNAIVVDVLSSEYEDRMGAGGDGVHADDAPQNVEWHEFTHHLHYTFVTQDTCAGEKSHGGYNNKDSCDSLDEGLAAFLPTLAAQDLDGDRSGRYDHFTNLENNIKAWDRSPGGLPNEDLAVAALLWDLVDSGPNADFDFPAIIGTDGQQFIKPLSEFVTMPVRDVWNLLVAKHTGAVHDLRTALGPQSPVVDLDGDGVNDVSLIDVPFIMHGFYPVDTNRPQNPNVFAFDVARAAAVGDSSHRVFDNSGGLRGVLIPRPNIPHDPRAWLGVSVLDNSGNPIPGATLHLTYRYPNGSLDTVDLRLASGSSRVYLDLPQYFKYLLPDDAPLPACDPANDAHADVTLTAEFNGTVSSDSAAIDNCAWAHAVVASTGSTALSYTLHVPVAGGTPPQQVQVPNVVGLTQLAASSAISSAGLTLGTSTLQSSTTIAAGNVIAENPAAGASVTLQSPVNLTVATNPLVCDANNDKRIDARDIAAILLAWTKHANGAYDPRDADRNGVINARDTAKCLTMCTSFLCSIK